MIRLHGYWRSSASYRVRIALNWKGVAFDTALVNLLAGEQRAKEYTRLNPIGRLPTLEIDGLRLVESQAIVEYLEETRPEPALLPRGAADRARVRAMAQYVVAGVQPMQNMSVLNRLASQFGADEEGVADWARHWLSHGLVALESAVAADGGAYCFGDTVSMADVMLAPQMYNARRFGLDMGPLSTLVAIDARLQELPAFAAAAPDVQPDAPAKE